MGKGRPHTGDRSRSRTVENRLTFVAIVSESNAEYIG